MAVRGPPSAGRRAGPSGAAEALSALPRPRRCAPLPAGRVISCRARWFFDCARRIPRRNAGRFLLAPFARRHPWRRLRRGPLAGPLVAVRGARRGLGWPAPVWPRRGLPPCSVLLFVRPVRFVSLLPLPCVAPAVASPPAPGAPRGFAPGAVRRAAGRWSRPVARSSLLPPALGRAMTVRAGEGRRCRAVLPGRPAVWPRPAAERAAAKARYRAAERASRRLRSRSLLVAALLWLPPNPCPPWLSAAPGGARAATKPARNRPGQDGAPRRGGPDAATPDAIRRRLRHRQGLPPPGGPGVRIGLSMIRAPPNERRAGRGRRVAGFSGR